MSFAIVFPGQGAQAPGMQQALAADYPEVTDTYAEASEVLGYDLWSLVQAGSQEDLDHTVVAQPAMLAAGVAVWRCWVKAGGPQPDLCAGHSLGEYSALVCAGALDYTAAIALVRHRAEFMRRAVPAGNGGMVALIGLDDDVVIDICARAGEGQIVSAANFNSPGQVVIAGDAAAVRRAAELAIEAGAKRALTLNVSVPSHCMLMQPAAGELSQHLSAADLAAPRFTVINNADVAAYETPEQIRDGLERQLFMPVRWVETIRRLRADGAESISEAGPGRVLAGLTRRIDRSIAGVSIDNARTLASAIELARSSGNGASA